MHFCFFVFTASSGTTMSSLDANTNTKSDLKHGGNERWYTIFMQVLFPFFIAGFGMVGAGVVLDKVQVHILTY